MKDILTTEEWIRAIKALLFLNKNPEDIDIEYIKKIIEESTAGAYELPTVSDEDNGKVLGVENGQFGLVDGGGDTGYECTETTEQLFSETVTTVEDGGVCFAQLNYLGLITADELTVIFNGTQYICPKIIVNGADGAYYGGVNPSTGQPDFTDFPFAIRSIDVNANLIVTESPMTVPVSVSVISSTVETTECFERAVKSVVDVGYECAEKTKRLFDEIVTTVENESDGVGFAQLDYSEPITADKIIVTFDGTQYVCPKVYEIGNVSYYGGYDPLSDVCVFTDFPFCIISTPAGNMLATETANTYHIKVAAVGVEATNISPCFASAVSQVSDSSVKIKNATLSANNVSVDGSETVIIPMPSDWASTLGVIQITPLETEDVYLSYFDCSGQREQFELHYISKQSSAVTIDEVGIIISYIPDNRDK